MAAFIRPDSNVDSLVVHSCSEQTFCYGNDWEAARSFIVEPLSANKCCCMYEALYLFEWGEPVKPICWTPTRPVPVATVTASLSGVRAYEGCVLTIS